MILHLSRPLLALLFLPTQTLSTGAPLGRWHKVYPLGVLGQLESCGEQVRVRAASFSFV